MRGDIMSIIHYEKDFDSLIKDKAVIDFPQPDSPTNPNALPFSKDKLILCTASKQYLSIWNAIFKFLISKKLIILL